MKHFLRPLIGRLAHALPAWLLVLWLPGAACAQAPAPAWATALALHALSGYSAVQATALDASGNVYLLGTFVGSVAFGATTLTSSGSDIFVAKYSPATSGFVWAQQAGGAYNKVYGLAVSGSSVYIAGFFAGTIGFGGVALTSTGGNDGFVAKLTDAGATASFTWAQRFGGAGSDAAYGLAVNGPAVYAAGEFGGTAAFGPLALASAGNQDGFVAKLVDAGPTAAVAWAQRLGGSSDDTANTLAVNGTAVYVGGNFQGGASVGSTGLRSAGAYDLFVAKLVDAGPAAAVAWAQRAGGPENDFVQTVAVSGANVYAAGTFARTAAFGAASLTSTGGDDLFVAKLTDAGPTGAFTWAQPAGGSGYDVLVAMAVSGPRVYVTGASGGTASFGSARLVSTGPLGSATGFVARLTDAGPTGSFAWVLGTGGRGADYANAVAAGGAQVYVGGTLNGSASFGTHPIADPFSVHIGYLASLTDATGLAAAAPAALVAAAVFPNPARATATVWVPATAGAAQATLILVDALGRAVRARTAALPAAGLRIELDLAGLPSGVYALRVAAGGQATTHRLVVE